MCIRDRNHIETAKNHALLPFVQLNEASNPEKEFVKYLEEHSQWIDSVSYTHLDVYKRQQ